MPGEICSEITALHGTTVRSLAVIRSEDSGLGFWIGTNKGLLRLDGADGPRPLLSPLFNDLTALPDLSIRSLAETVGSDGEKSLWVATDRGVARLKAGAGLATTRAPASRRARWSSCWRAAPPRASPWCGRAASAPG